MMNIIIGWEIHLIHYAKLCEILYGEPQIDSHQWRRYSCYGKCMFLRLGLPHQYIACGFRLVLL